MRYALHSKPVDILAAALAVAALGLAAGAKTPSKTAQTSETPSPPVTNLYPAGNIDFSAPAPMGVIGGTQCDTNGNIYLKYAPSVQIINQMMRMHHTVEIPPLRKLAIDSREIVKFAVGPFQGYTRASGSGFFVTPRGTVYSLACGVRSDSERKGYCDWLVTKYNDDGSVDSTAKLRVPEGVNLQPSKIAVFLDGNLLVAGFSISQESGIRPYSAIFDRSGDFLTNFTLPQDVAPAPPPTMEKKNSRGKPSASGPTAKDRGAGVRLSLAISGTRIVGSPDGTLYLLRAGSPERLYVLSSVGKVLREQIITPPRQGLSPLMVSLTGQDQLFIFFTHIPMPGDISPYSALALVDPKTGKVISTYDFPPNAGIPACMTTQGEILFTRESKSGHLEVAEYTPE